jgi:FecR protein
MYPISLRALRWSDGVPVLALLVVLACALGGRAFAAPPSIAAMDVTVVAVEGEVSVSTQGSRHAVHKGDLVSLPATIYTGPSGSLELQQNKTTLSAAPNTELTIPAPTVTGEAFDRVIQSRGNAFYSVAKREVRKLHVEAAYLVAVIKGTQFSVVAQDDSTTISLFEGRLEVHAADYSDAVNLEAGEIAIRHAGDSAIRMLRMDTGEPVARNADPDQMTGADPAGSEATPGAAPTPLPVSTSQGAAAVAGTVGTEARAASAATAGAALSPVPLSAEAALSAGGTSVSGNASLGNGSGSIGGTVATNAAGVAASASTSVSLSAASGTASVSTSVNAAIGSSTATVGLAAATSPTGISAGAAATVSTPVASSTAGLTATTSPAGTTAGVATSVTTPVALAPVAATVSVGSGTLGVTVSTPVTTINLGTSSAVSPATTTTTGTSSTSTPTTNPPTNPIKALLGH